MKIINSLTEDALLNELGERLTHFRLNQNVTQAELAQKAGVSKRTVERIEAGDSIQLSNLIRVLRALGLLENIELLVPQPAPSPLEQLKLQGKERVRASSPPEKTAEPGTWTWGEES